MSDGFDGLLESALNGELTADDLRRLEAILDADAAARARYVQATALDTDLWLGTEKAAARPALPPPRRRIPAVPLGFAAAALLFAVLLVIRESGDGSEGAAPAVAWRARGFEGPASLGAGAVVALSEGRGEILFAGGARLLLQGPSEAAVAWTHRAELRRGRATVHVPQGDDGFLLDTPDATLTLTDGEYGVEVSPGHGTRVTGFRGEGEVQPRARGLGSLLKAGEALRIDGDGTVVPEAASEGRFLRMGELADKTRRTVVDDAFDGDALSSSWRVVLSAPRSRARAVEGRLRLENRAWLATASGYDPIRLGGVRVRGRWRYSTPSSPDANARVNIFTVALRADLAPARSHHELARGLKLNVFTDNGRIHLNAEGGPFQLSRSRHQGFLKHPGIGTYAFEIVDDGATVTASVWDEADPKNRAQTRALVLRDAATEDRIVFYGREFHLPDRIYAVELEDVAIETGVGP